MSRKFTIEVKQTVEVTLDDARFDDGFMEEFRRDFFPFFTLADHAEHIGQMEARGLTNLEMMPQFIEGYGPSDDMGIKARVIDTEVERLPQ